MADSTETLTETTPECPWCGETGHGDGECLARDPFTVETWNEVLS